MDWYKQIFISCRRIEIALSLKHKNLSKLNSSDVLSYYEGLCDKITAWEEENNMELVY